MRKTVELKHKSCRNFSKTAVANLTDFIVGPQIVHFEGDKVIPRMEHETAIGRYGLKLGG